MSKFKKYIVGKMLVWIAKQEGYSEEEIDSGLMIMSLEELLEVLPNKTAVNLIEGRE